jgi:hypothetical protein
MRKLIKIYFFTFRNKKSLDELISLMYYTQVSFFNFNIKNDKNSYKGYKIIDSLQPAKQSVLRKYLLKSSAKSPDFAEYKKSKIK